MRLNLAFAIFHIKLKNALRILFHYLQIKIFLNKNIKAKKDHISDIVRFFGLMELSSSNKIFNFSNGANGISVNIC